MDGNGRWANERGLPRTAGHAAGEAALLDVVAGAIEVGVTHVSAYAFCTENWKRSPDEVRFLMGFNRDVLRRRRDTMHAWGVRVRWAGRRPRLWRSVIAELETAEQLTRGQRRLHADHVRQLRRPGRDRRRRARDRARGRGRAPRPRRRSTSGRSPATSTSPTCPTSTCSCAPRASSGRQQLHDLAGRVRRAGVPRRVLARRGPARTCGAPWRPTRGATAATAAPWTRPADRARARRDARRRARDADGRRTASRAVPAPAASDRDRRREGPR